MSLQTADIIFLLSNNRFKMTYSRLIEADVIGWIASTTNGMPGSKEMIVGIINDKPTKVLGRKIWLELDVKQNMIARSTCDKK